MRNLKAKMFNRKASDPRNKPDRVLEALELRQGQNVADIGAGAAIFVYGLQKPLEEGKGVCG